jgi:hypothetical protein
MPMAVTASDVVANPPASVGSPMVLPTTIGEPHTNGQRQLILCVMAKVWGVFSPREFQVRAMIARLTLRLASSSFGRREKATSMLFTYLCHALAWRVLENNALKDWEEMTSHRYN